MRHSTLTVILAGSGAWAAFGAAGPLAGQAQEPTLTEEIARAQPPRYEDPACDIGTGHFKVKGAAVYIQTALENPVNRNRLLEDSERTLIEAITENDQQDNPGAWYILGRVKLYQGDLIAADSAFDRVDQLAPECGEDVNLLRRNSWIVVRNHALGLKRENLGDSAATVYRMGMAIYQDDPDVFYVMASLYDNGVNDDSMAAYLEKAVLASDPANESHARIRSIAMRRLAPLLAEQGKTDSAVAYFEMIAEEARAADDTVKLHSAESQAARALFEAEEFPAALAMFRRIEARRPDDQMVKRNIATVFQAMGQMDSAQAVMASLGGAAGPATIDTSSADFLINRGANKYAEQNYAGAIADWARAAEVQPSSRLPLINLGLAYNATQDGANLVKVAKRSLEREPLHEFSYKLLLQGYIYLEDGDGARAADADIQGLPLNVDSLIVSSGPGGITINGKAMARDRPSPDMTLRFDFLGADGSVKVSNSVTIPALVAGTSHDFTVTGSGSEIVNWRYRRE